MLRRASNENGCNIQIATLAIVNDITSRLCNPSVMAAVSSPRTSHNLLEDKEEAIEYLAVFVNI